MLGPNGAVPPALMGLLASIPARGWTQEAREKFVTAFGHVLDFSVPIITAAEASDAAAEDEAT